MKKIIAIASFGTILLLLVLGAGCGQTANQTPQTTEPSEAANEQPVAEETETNNSVDSVAEVTEESAAEVEADVEVNNDDSETEKTPADPAEPAEPAWVEISMTAKNWEFDPYLIAVNKGDKVRISVTSLDVEHGLSIPEFGINQNIPAGETVEIGFIADKVGEFSFRCSVFCGDGHKEMAGKIVVTE